MNVQLTSHAIQRGKERLNLSERSLHRTAQKAFDCGLCHSQLKGELWEWAVNKLDSQNATSVRIMGHQAFVFYQNLLLTVLLVPHGLMPKPPRLRNWPEEEFEEEDLEDDENPPDIKKYA